MTSFTDNRSALRAVAALLGLAAVAALGTALYLQHVEEQDPCPLCILQRYAWVVAGLAAWIGAFAGARRGVFMGALMVTALSGLAGLGVALHHLWVLGHPEQECGRDPLEVALNQLPTANWFPGVFQSRGFCAAQLPPLLGLSLPAWSAIGLSATAAMALVLLWRARSRRA